MKIFKRIQVMFLALVMCLGSVGGKTALAAEIHNEAKETIATYDFEILTAETGGEIDLLAVSNVNNTFNVYNSHTGSSRNYSGNYLRYCIEITDVNGNPVDNILAVQLYDSTNTLRRENQFWADGSLNIIQDIPISSNRSYYFKYLLAYGTTRTLRVHMEISSYS